MRDKRELEGEEDVSSRVRREEERSSTNYCKGGSGQGSELKEPPEGPHPQVVCPCSCKEEEEEDRRRKRRVPQLLRQQTQTIQMWF